MAGDVGWIEPLERQHARPGTAIDTGTHCSNAPLHIFDQILGASTDPRCAPDVANAREDGGEIVGVERQNMCAQRSANDLALRDCTDIANSLRQYQVRLEPLNLVVVDLIYAAVIP